MLLGSPLHDTQVASPHWLLVVHVMASRGIAAAESTGWDVWVDRSHSERSGMVGLVRLLELTILCLVSNLQLQ